MDKVSLFINGKIYDGWKTVELTRSLKAASGSFSLSITDRWSNQKEPWIIAPDDKAEIQIGNDLILTGYVDTVSSDADKDSYSIAVAGRDKTADLIDCSIESTSGQFKNVTIKKLAETLCAPFSVPVVCDSPGAVFETFAIQQGETVFEALERAARKRGLLLTTDGKGSLVITSPAATRSTTRLEQGENIKAMGSVFEGKNRFSKYIVKGQDNAIKGDPSFSFAIKATATDSNVKRYRPLIIQSEQLTSLADAKTRANWEATVRAAKASKFNIVVQGWRQGDKTLWRPNQLVLAIAPRIGLNGELLITDVKYTLESSGGSITVLTLERKDAYLPAPEVPEKTDPLIQAIKKDPGIKRGPQ